MPSLNVSMYFAILIFFVISHHCTFAKSLVMQRSCASFGHSCYGGHGKRSSTSKTSFEIGARMPRNTYFHLISPLPSTWDGKWNNGVNALARKLIKTLKESRRMHKKYQGIGFDNGNNGYY